MTHELYQIADLTDHLVAAVDAARGQAAGNMRWLNAIEAGYSWLLEQDTISFDVTHHELLVNSPSGRSYRSNGVCQCEAFSQHNACWHRAAARLVRRALEGKAHALTAQALRLESAFLAPTNDLLFALSTDEQALFWERYDTIAATFSTPSRSQALPAAAARAKAYADVESLFC